MKTNNFNLDRRLLGILLTPSWLSAVVAISGSIGVVAGTIIMTHFQGSAIQLNYYLYKASPENSVAASANQGLLDNQLISNLPLLLFWALIGVVVYMFAINLFNAIRTTAEIKSELEYTNIDRRSLLKTAGQHLVIRLVVLLVWVFYIQFFFQQIVPYCITATMAGMSQFPGAVSIIYMVLAFAVMAFALHVHAVMLRLLLLKPRAFTSALYVD